MRWMGLSLRILKPFPLLALDAPSQLRSRLHRIGGSVASLRTQQHFLTVRGRQLHFVAYEEQPGNPRRGVEPIPAMWCLMAGSSRCPVMAFDPAQGEADLAAALTLWAEGNAFGGPEEPPVVVDPVAVDRRRWLE